MEVGNNNLVGLVRGATLSGVYNAMVSLMSIEVVATDMRGYTLAKAVDGL